jgi:hypothetical protein
MCISYTINTYICNVKTMTQRSLFLVISLAYGTHPYKAKVLSTLKIEIRLGFGCIKIVKVRFLLYKRGAI